VTQPPFYQPLRSIFSLRPLAKSELPAPADPKPGPRPSRAKLVALAALAGALGAAGFGIPKLVEAKKEAPILLVNGSAKTKAGPTGEDLRWGHAELTVKIDESCNELGKGAREAIESGFGTWLASDAELPSLRFDTARGTKPKLERDGVNSVIYAPIEFPGHTKDLAITIGFADPDTGRIAEADIVINTRQPFGVLTPDPKRTRADDDDERAGDDCSKRFDLQNVVTHEVGHFFGLDEDMDDGLATMYYTSERCELKKRDLSTDDRTVMTTLYVGASQEDDAARSGGCGGARIVGSKLPQSGLFAAAIGILGALFTLRRARTR